MKKLCPENKCPSCGSTEIKNFYEISRVPVHSVLLFHSREKAIEYPKGDINLVFCQKCGFISNIAFDSSLHEYSSKYEETQGYSSTFNDFHEKLAKDLIERYNLHGKSIIEIGCGKGEFLSLLCELGNNRGVGFDPSYVSERNPGKSGIKTTFIKDFYSEKYADYRGDFVCCKMTLEHIQNTQSFIVMLRRLIGDESKPIVFFQVPDVSRILNEVAFWDIYYEHCSYFSTSSLSGLFQRCGFEVIRSSNGYDDQYLMLEGQPNGKDKKYISEEQNKDILEQAVECFSRECYSRIEKWKDRLSGIKKAGKTAVLWGAGSKGVAFLTTLEINDEIAYAVDINPYKHETYMAGSGHKIVAPEFMKEYRPDFVVVMNSIYCNEIHLELDKMGISSQLLSVDSF